MKPHLSIIITSFALLWATGVSSTSSFTRVELDCTKIYEEQTIGVFDEGGTTLGVSASLKYKAFKDFGCDGVIQKARMKSGATAELTILGPKSSNGNRNEKVINFDGIGDNLYLVTGGDVQFKNGSNIIVVPSLNPINGVDTPSSNLECYSAGCIDIPARSMNLELTVVVGYQCDEWKTDNFCYPAKGYHGPGVVLQNRTCQSLLTGVYEPITQQVKAENCTLSPNWTDWTSWSACDTLDANEICGNGSRYRFMTKCHVENFPNGEPEDKWCGDKIIHVQSCKVFCQEDYKYHPEIWTQYTECEIYRSDIQNSKDGCGNGFQSANQSQCVMGDEYVIAPQNLSWCPPAGIKIKNCYVPCSDAIEVNGLVPKTNYQFLNCPLEVPHNSTIFGEYAPLKITMKFVYAFYNKYYDPANVTARKPAGNNATLLIQFNKYVYVDTITLKFNREADNWKMNGTIYSARDKENWEKLSEEKNINQDDSSMSLSIRNEEKMASMLKIELTFDATTSCESISAKLEEFSYKEPGNWTEWGSWGECLGNCRNSSYNRTRNCTANDGRSTDPKYCVGVFMEYQKCKCPEDFHWSFDEENDRYGDCADFILPARKCGTGWAYLTPSLCWYLNDTDTIYDANLCGEKPVVAQSCFKACPGTCGSTSKSSVTKAAVSGFKFGTNGDVDIIFEKIESMDLPTNPIGPGLLKALVKPGYMKTIYEMKEDGTVSVNRSYTKVINGTIELVDAIRVTIHYCVAPVMKYKRSNCSVQCGNGTVTLTPICSGLDDIEKELYYCDGLLKEKKEECSTGIICYNQTQWAVWGDCGGECGVGGSKNRTRYCTEDGVEAVDQDKCMTDGKFVPGNFTETEDCYNEVNRCHKWGNWTEWEIDRSIGHGYKCETYTEKRQRECYDDSGIKDLSGPQRWVEAQSDMCQPDSTNLTNQQTNITVTQIPCYRWNVSSTSECSGDCGVGTEIITRVCESFEGVIGDPSSCVGLDEFNETVTKNCTHKIPCTAKVTEWSDWSYCSKLCNTGEMTRERICRMTVPASCRSFVLKETLPCNTQVCKIDGYWTNYTQWSPCSVSCGSGQKMQIRSCYPPFYGGKNCTGGNETSGEIFEEVHMEECETGVECPGSYIEPYNCTYACGLRNLFCSVKWFSEMAIGDLALQLALDCNNKTKFEKFSHHPSYNAKTTDCLGFAEIGNVECDANPPEDVQRICHCVSKDEERMGAWSKWGECSTTCGPGTKSRLRGLVRVDTESEVFTHNEPCNVQRCPVDGEWGSWTGYGKCSVECGTGSRNRTRACNDPPPSDNPRGRPCQGVDISFEDCGDPPVCPVDGQWSAWKLKSNCSMTCRPKNSSVPVTRTYIRECNNPEPDLGGKDCEGSNEKEQECEDVAECNPVKVDVKVNFVTEEYNEAYKDLESEESVKLKNKIYESLKALYPKQMAKDPDFVKVILHDLQDGTGIETDNSVSLKDKKKRK